MNLILLLFILLASMFLASSVNNLAALTGAVDHFIEISNVPDLFVLALTDGQNDPIRDFLAKNENVKNYEKYQHKYYKNVNNLLTKKQK